MKTLIKIHDYLRFFGIFFKNINVRFFFVCTVYIHYIAKMIGACIVKVKVLAKN